jgi:hypothetical protein
MFHEFEILLWASLCEPKVINDLIRNNTSDELDNSKIVLNHLINTAYYTKR